MRMWWMAHNFAADIRSAARAAFEAFLEDWRSSQLPASRGDRRVDDRSEWDGYINGLIFAGNLKTRVPRGDEGSRVLNDIRDQIDSEIERAQAKSAKAVLDGVGWEIMVLDQRAAECMRSYDHAKLGRVRVYVSIIRSAVRAAIEALLDDWRSSQFHRGLAEEHYDREAMMAGEWHE